MGRANLRPLVCGRRSLGDKVDQIFIVAIRYHGIAHPLRNRCIRLFPLVNLKIELRLPLGIANGKESFAFLVLQSGNARSDRVRAEDAYAGTRRLLVVFLDILGVVATPCLVRLLQAKVGGELEVRIEYSR